MLDQTTKLNTHPGTILKIEFLEEMEISTYRLCKEIGLGQSHVSRVIKGEVGISADLATRLSKFFGTTAEFWMTLQVNYELRKVYHEKREVIEGINTWVQEGSETEEA